MTFRNTKLESLKQITKLITILHATKNKPDALFILLRNCMGGTIYDNTCEGDKFIVEDVIPHFIKNIKMMRYIYDAIQPIIEKNINIILDNLYRKKYYHIIVLNMIIIKNKKMILTLQNFSRIDELSLWDTTHWFSKLFSKPTAIIMLYKFQCGIELKRNNKCTRVNEFINMMFI